MNIALIGYGKMGHAIERIAVERGHTIVLKISSGNRSDLTPEHLRAADVAIEFTSPEAAPANVQLCLEAGLPVICGTTGWNEQLDAMKELATSKGVGFLQASNFSVGVNIFFEINKQLAKLMARQPDYKVSVEEVHHLQKKDKPSGTAITLAEQIIDQAGRFSTWELSGNPPAPDTIAIDALRVDGVPGTHTISWQSAIDTIDIRHTAHNRDGFALGAVLAAEFIRKKTGVYTMRDVLAI